MYTVFMAMVMVIISGPVIAAQQDRITFTTAIPKKPAFSSHVYTFGTQRGFSYTTPKKVEKKEDSTKATHAVTMDIESVKDRECPTAQFGGTSEGGTLGMNIQSAMTEHVTRQVTHMMGCSLTGDAHALLEQEKQKQQLAQLEALRRDFIFKLNYNYYIAYDLERQKQAQRLADLEQQKQQEDLAWVDTVLD